MSRFRVAGLFAIVSLFGGCSDADWDHLLSFSSPDNAPSQTVVADASPVYTAPAPPVQSAEIAPPPQQVYTAPQPSYSTTTTVTTAAPVQSATVAPPPPQQAYTAPQPSYSVTTTVTTARVDPTMSYCHMVAQGSGAVATHDGLDNGEQQNAADATYQACMAVYGEKDR